MKNQAWSASDTSNARHLGTLEFQSRSGEWHNFEVLATPSRLVFGGACNAGFLESGFLTLEDGEAPNDALGELYEDLETFYNDGPRYVSRIICNARM